MKKVFVYFAFLCIFFTVTACGNTKNTIVSDYDTSTLEGDFLKNDNEAYEIGANQDGQPIFKDNENAFSQALIDFEDGFLAIQEEYDLEPVNSENFLDYKIHGPNS